MLRRGLCAVFVLLCAGICPAANEDVRWLEVRSPHFLVISNAEEPLARGTVAQFELFREVFQVAMPGMKIDSGTPLVILAVKDEKTLKSVLPENWEKRSVARTGGYFLRGLGKNYVAIRLDAVGDNPYHVVYHEYAHNLINLTYGIVPLWLSEGFAEFFGHTAITAQGALVGIPSASELAILRKTELLRLETLFAVDFASPYYSEETQATIFYAQSWALTHFLMMSEQGERRTQLTEYLRLLDKDVPALQAATQAFGDLTALSRDLTAYVQQLSFTSLRVPPRAAMDDSAIVVREIPMAESLAIRGDILLHNERYTEARKLLSEALWQNPDLPLANESMGFLLFRQGDRTGAEKWFALAAELDSRNALVHYYHALALAREGEDIGDFDATEKHLLRAIQLNPDFALAYSMLALAYATQDAHLDEALRLARYAADLEPGTLEHQLRVGSVLLRMDRIQEAQHIAQRVGAAAKNEEDRQAAVEFLGQIRKYQEYQALKKKYETQVAAEQTALDERRLQRPLPSANPAQPPTYTAPPTSGNSSIEGLLADVACSGTAALELNVEHAGKSTALHADNFLRIEYYGAEWQPPKDFQPCKHLAGLRARVTFQIVMGQPFAGKIISIEVLK